jgi:WD40 repeat protein
VPRDLETVCLKCMAKNPAARYATAEELADDLQRCLDGRAIHARPVSRVERVGRWARRNPLAAGLSAVAVALAVVGLSGVTWKWRDAEWHAHQAELKADEAVERRKAERWELYRASIAIAAADLRTNTLGSTLHSLERAPEEYRNWEWRHYRNQLNVAREVYPVAGGTVRGSFTAAPGRVVISQDDRIRLWDVGERREVFVSTGGENRGWHTLADGRRFAFARDGRVVIRSCGGDTPDVVLSDPDGALDACAVSADGGRVLTGGGRGPRVWDTATGKPVSPARGGTLHLGTCALSADGGLSATHVVESGDLEVWDTATGETRFTVPGLRDLYWVRFSPDGTRVAVNEAYPLCRVRQWDTRTGKPAGEFAGHINNVMEMAHSPDGAVAATCSRDLSVRLWEAATGRERAVLRGHTGIVNAVAFSPDGTRVVSAAADMTVRIWDVATGAELSALRGHTGEVLTAGFADDGTVVSAARDGTVRVWDVRPATAGGVWTGHKDKGYVYQVAYHPDGEHVLSASWDGTARIWDAAGREVGRLDHGPAVNVVSVAVHPAGRLVATLGKNDQVWVWDFATRTKLHTTQGSGRHWMTPRLAFSPDGGLLAVGGCQHGDVRLFDPDGLREVGVLSAPAHCVGDLTFSPDGKLLAVGNSGGMLKVWDVARREVVAELHGHTDEIRALAFSHDGKRLASGSADGTVQIWTAADWGREGELRYGVRVYGLAFTPDDTRLACGCADSTIRLCDPARREVVAELHGHTDFVHAVAFSPDGHRLVSASGDLTVRTWDARPPD